MASVASQPAVGSEKSADFPLPAMRADVRILNGAPAADGMPTWLLFDPARHRYFSIGWLDHAALRVWSLGRAAAVLDQVWQTTGHALAPSQIQDIADFLQRHELTACSQRRDVSVLLDRHEKGAHNRTGKLAHAYVFFRIPLFHPDRWLEAWLPLVRPLFGRIAWGFLAVLGFWGLYLTARRWDEVWTSLPYFFTVEGMALYAGVIAALKVAHEFGHAFTAKRYGCHVPSMGMGFMLLWPILYTDTSDAWRLTNRSQRLAIAAAGVVVELALAVIATFLWRFFPPGPGRSILLTVATVSWLMTLLVNLNPFMRFDGYFLLADALDMANLQSRAFALGRWRLREALFGFGAAPPENFAPSRRRLLIIYAYATWTYRVILFTGIALAVYHFLFKAAGILLFLLELGLLIGRPVLKEMAVWWRLRHRADGRTTAFSAVLLAFGVGVLAYPWQGWITVPAVLQSAEHVRIFPQLAGRLVSLDVTHGQEVRQGEVLMVLASPDLDHRLRELEIEIGALNQQLQRRTAQAEDLGEIFLLENELAARLAEWTGQQRQKATLILRAPIDGRVTELTSGLRPGTWLNPETPVFALYAPDVARIEAFVNERELFRLRTQATGLFLPDGLERPSLTVTRADTMATPVVRLNRLALASLFGGPLAVRMEDDGLVPDQAIYRMLFRLQRNEREPPKARRPVHQTVVGRLRVKAEAESVLAWAGRLFWAVVVRESGV